MIETKTQLQPKTSKGSDDSHSKKELKISAIFIFPTFQWIPFQVTQRNMNMLGLNKGLLIKQINFIKFSF